MASRASIRSLRVGIVPDDDLEHTSVGYSEISAVIEDRLLGLLCGQDPRPIFIRGEWGTGKRHCLTYLRAAAATGGIPASLVSLDARSAALNYPQRISPLLTESIRVQDRLLGLREVLSTWLTKAPVRQTIRIFAQESSAGSLAWPLATLCSLFERGDLCGDDT